MLFLAHIIREIRRHVIKWYEPSAYNLRSSTQRLLSVPSYRLKTVGFRRFARAAPFLWNKMPSALRDTTDIEKFKRDLKTHIFKEL